MFLLLLAFWFILNANITLEITITGLVLCTALYLFCWRFLDISPKKEWNVCKRLFRIISYLFWLVGQIFASAYSTIKLIWSPSLKVQPQLISFKTKLKTETGRVVLCDSITLTPGTISIALHDDEVMVHCLDESFAEGIEDNTMLKKVRELERGKGDE